MRDIAQLELAHVGGLVVAQWLAVAAVAAGGAGAESACFEDEDGLVAEGDEMARGEGGGDARADDEDGARCWEVGCAPMVGVRVGVRGVPVGCGRMGDGERGERGAWGAVCGILLRWWVGRAGVVDGGSAVCWRERVSRAVLSHTEPGAQASD